MLAIESCWTLALALPAAVKPVVVVGLRFLCWLPFDALDPDATLLSSTFECWELFPGRAED